MSKREIVRLFEQHLPESSNDQDPSRIELSNQIPVLEKVLNWFDGEGPSDDLLEPTSGPSEPGMGTRNYMYSDLIPATSAYKCLLDAMRQELVLITHEEYIRAAIRREITKILPPFPKLSTKKQMEGVKLLYMIPWDPMTFISEQGYPEDPHIALERAITLTGTLTNAQALPCV